METLLRYLIYVVVATFVPLVLAGNAPAEVLRRRYVIVGVAAILGGLYTGFEARFPDLVGASASVMSMSDSQPALVLAVASGTVLYLLGNLLFGQNAAPKTR